MHSQRLEVSTQLSLCSLPVGKGRLCRYCRDYVLRTWLGMAVARILLDLVEGSLLAA
jgi:hypothetical protein